MAALARRDETGVGVLVEAAMQDAAVNVTAEQAMQYADSGLILTRQGNRSYEAAPQGVYPCVAPDSWIVIAVTNDHQWRRLVDIIGDARLTSSELSTPEGRRTNHDLCDEAIAAWTSGLDRDEILGRLVEAEVPVAPVIDPVEKAVNAHFRARGFFESVDHPVSGTHEFLTMPFGLSTWKGRWFRTPAPTLGQHTREVLGQLVGLDDSELDALEAAHVIGASPI
jgi:crotonobetainyl-CoA:carnitine CoA-transferase CaiB-like acyl-CoA transferase